MLRLRLFYGLLILVTLLWTVGAAAILLMRQSATRNDARMRADYEVIRASQSVRTITASLNVNYLPALAAQPVGPRPDREMYDRLNQRLDESLALLHKQQPDDPRWNELVNRFDSVIGSYREGYEGYFGDAYTSLDERGRLMQFISMQTQRLTDLSDNMIALVEEELLSPAAGETLGMNTLFVVILVLLGTTIAILIYNGLTRHLVDPMVSLRRSIDEIRRGNFELAISEPRQSSEFAPVVSAFNDMVAELKVRRGESDQSLARANTVMRSILEAIPSPVFILEDDSGIVQINPAAERLSEKLGVIGRLPAKIQHILDECQKTNSNFMPEDPRDALLFRIDEVEFYFLPRIFRFQSAGAAKSGWAILLHNVSRIRWLDDMKTNLLSTVSHEIKTPLTGIRMVLHLLLEDRGQNLSEVQRMMIASANDDSERLLLTLNSLLELSRAESGATQLSCVPTQLKDNVDRSVRLYTNAAAQRDITLAIDQSQSDLPEVLADAVRLDEVINNLLSNAIKHSPDGGTVKLCLSKPDADHVRVSVIDQGPGVPEGSKSRIFERFFRAPGQKQEGVGLGLFISREIIRAHEGRIGINERTDKLTEFYFDVPIA
jgi:two-component system, NtrC family, sensor histidine kinase KinB